MKSMFIYFRENKCRKIVCCIYIKFFSKGDKNRVLYKSNEFFVDRSIVILDYTTLIVYLSINLSNQNIFICCFFSYEIIR